MKTLDCPFCGNSNTVTRKIVKQEFDYKGQQLVLDDYVVHECSKCYESFEIPDDNTTNQEKLIVFQRKVDGLLRPDEIRKIRESLGFTQKGFAALLGVGEKTFTRYERGTVVQGRSMDNLLRLIRKDPSGSIETLTQADEQRALRNRA